MNIYPAIDLIAGQCVRLTQGDFKQIKSYNTDPIAVAKNFAQNGAETLHVVDLDGAKSGELQQLDLIKEIQNSSGLNLQVGGGICDEKIIEAVLDGGISKVILGTIAVKQPELVKKWLKTYGIDNIVLSFDIRCDKRSSPIVAIAGWQQSSQNTLWQMLDIYQDLKYVLCTDIARDGMLNGANTALYKECQKRYPHIRFQASGGIHTLDDLSLLKNIPVSGAVIGKAFYENKFSLSDAINQARNIC